MQRFRTEEERGVSRSKVAGCKGKKQSGRAHGEVGIRNSDDQDDSGRGNAEEEKHTGCGQGGCSLGQVHFNAIEFGNPELHALVFKKRL